MDNPENQQLESENRELKTRLDRYEQQLRGMSIVNAIAEAANSTSNPSDAVFTSLFRICTDTNWPLGHAFEVRKNHNKEELVSTGVWYLSDDSRYDKLINHTQQLRLKSGQGLPGIVFRDKEALWANAVKSDAKRFALARKLGLQSTFAFPVLIGNEVVAVVELFSDRNVAPDEVVLDIVAQLGIILGRVFERHRASEEKDALNKKLIVTSRQAGMAEVASGVLHNVGNALNGITVSSTLLQEALNKTSIGGVSKAAQLLNEHADDLGSFFSTDPRAKKILPYLNTLFEQLQKEQKLYNTEMLSLTEHVKYVKSIIHRQQLYANPNTIRESVQLAALVDDALKMNSLFECSRHINVVRDYEDLPTMILDKQNVIQILNNLLGNAKHAICGNISNPSIIVSTRLSDNSKSVTLTVQDNGCGIPIDKQAFIFQFGFTTKKNGHGFGLHTSANAAKNMGGNLAFTSDGEGAGTTFTLSIPYEAAEEKEGGIAA